MRPHDRLQLTSIVTMTDSGGDSGRLRTEFNVLPPGDLRRCLVALSNESPLLREPCSTTASRTSRCAAASWATW